MKKKGIYMFLIITLVMFLLDNISNYNIIREEGFKLLDFIGFASTTLFYILPIGIMTFLVAKSYKIKFFPIILSFLGGAYLIGLIAGELNFSLNLIFQAFLGFPDNFHLLESSVVPPLVEESLKLIIVIIIGRLFNLKSLTSYLLLGLASGIGFQFTEDLSYILNSMTSTDLSGLEMAIIRLDGAFSTHFVWTSITSGAYYLMIKEKVFNVKIILFLLGPLMIHMIWNSNLLVTNLNYLLISVISWNLFNKIIVETKNNYDLELENEEVF